MIGTFQAIVKSRLFNVLAKLQLLIAIGIFTYAALMPSNQITDVTCDQCLHFLGNILLVLSACLATLGRHKGWILLVGVLPYSIAIELGQFFTQTRQVDPNDLVANLAGLLFGYSCVMLIEWTWHKLPHHGHTEHEENSNE